MNILVVFVTYLFGNVDVGQAVEAEDVSFLPVLVDLVESQSCSTLRLGVFT